MFSINQVLALYHVLNLQDTCTKFTCGTQHTSLYSAHALTELRYSAHVLTASCSMMSGIDSSLCADSASLVDRRLDDDDDVVR